MPAGYGHRTGEMNRRHFCARLLAGLSLLPQYLAGAAGRARGTAATMTPSGIFRYPAAAEAVGRAYLARHPDAPLDTLAAAGLGSAHSAHALREDVQTRSRADFYTGNTVLVDGWVLSRAEACACALAARLAPG